MFQAEGLVSAAAPNRGGVEHELSDAGMLCAMLPDEYTAEAARRMTTDGSVVSQVQLATGPAVVGYQSKFRLRWFATKLHVFTVVVAVPTVTAETLAQVSQQAVDYAKQTKGKLRGLQTGVAALPVLVTTEVAPDGRDAAETRPPKAWAAFVLPEIVDLSSGQVHRYHGRLVWGGLYAAWLRERLDALPTPPTTR